LKDLVVTAAGTVIILILTLIAVIVPISYLAVNRVLLVAGAATMVLIITTALLSAIRHNARLRQLRPLLDEVLAQEGRVLITLDVGDHYLFAGPRRAYAIDRTKATMGEVVDWAEVEALVMNQDSYANYIQFRFDMLPARRSRRYRATNVAEFSKLFVLMKRLEKDMRYESFQDE
jgi:hypothetical protein